MHKLKENLKLTYGDLSTAIGGETSDKLEGEWTDMSKYRIARGIAIASNVASDEVITLTMLKATASDGSGSATTTYTDTYTSTEATDIDVLQAEIKAIEAGTGYQWIGARVASDGGSSTAVVTLLVEAGIPRYGQATLP